MGYPSKLGRYELRRILGKGAMGVVYEGFDPTLGRRVAIKTILKSAVIDEETERAYLARFAREARAVGRLNHPHIVQVYDFGEQGEVAYLVMEFIEGRELREFFDAGERFELTESVRIMGELLDALHVAHEAGVIHRDVKPANVMLDAQRRVKLADFGVARIQDGTDRSRAGTLVGTPAFMSPEQVTGGRIDRRTDVFSAGIVLYQLLTGEQPFAGDGAWTIAKKITQDEPPRPSTIAASVSPTFDQIINRALAKKPEQRFASASEFAVALRAALEGQVVADSGPRASDTELEFWRAIQNSTDAGEYQVYLQKFPKGAYAELARIRIARLPDAQMPDLTVVDSSSVLREEKARLEEQIAAREAEYRKREAALESARQLEAKARAEAEAKREADLERRMEVEAKARRDEIERARKEAEALAARREAEAKAKYEAEIARRDSEAAAAKAKAETEARARSEAEAAAKREAEARALKDAEALSRARDAALARAKGEAEERARREKEIATREAELKRQLAARPRAGLPLTPIVATLLVIAVIAGGAYYYLSGDQERVQAELVARLKALNKATRELDLARQRQEELNRTVEVARLAEADARAKGDAAKLKDLQEATKRAEADAQKQADLVKQREAEAKKADDATKLADAKKAEAAKAAEKAVAEKLAAEKAAAEKIAAEKAAAEKAAQENATQKAAQQAKVASEKSAAVKPVTAKPAAIVRSSLPNVGDRWVYEAHDTVDPEKKSQIIVEVQAVGPSSIRDVSTAKSGPAISMTHYAGANLVGIAPGIPSFSPYLRAFQELRAGERWSNVNFERLWDCSTNTWWDCTASARVGNRETITVRAGNFDTTKIEVELRYRKPPNPGGVGSVVQGNVLLTYWYAEEARRYVKFQSRANSNNWSFNDMDMELVSYTPATVK